MEEFFAGTVILLTITSLVFTFGKCQRDDMELNVRAQKECYQLTKKDECFSSLRGNK